MNSQEILSYLILGIWASFVNTLHQCSLSGNVILLALWQKELLLLFEFSFLDTFQLLSTLINRIEGSRPLLTSNRRYMTADLQKKNETVSSQPLSLPNSIFKIKL